MKRVMEAMTRSPARLLRTKTATVVGVANETVTSLVELPIELVQHNIA